MHGIFEDFQHKITRQTCSFLHLFRPAGPPSPKGHERHAGNAAYIQEQTLQDPPTPNQFFFSFLS